MRRSVLPIVVGGLLAAVVGALVPGRPVLVPTAAVLGPILLYFCLTAPLASVGYALFLSTLATRLRMPATPLLLEQVMLLLSAAGLVARGRLDLVVRAAGVLPRAVWMFVAWGALISVLRSPDVSASLTIVGWMTSSMLIGSLVAVLCVGVGGPVSPIAARLTALVAGAALVGVAAWVLAFIDPDVRLGVQTELLTGAPSAFGLSFEANIFGGICAIWLVIDTLYVRRASLYSSALVRGLLGLGVLVSLTRAATLGAVVGVVVGAVATRRSRRVGATVICAMGIGVGGILLVGPSVPIVRPFIEKGARLLDLESSTTVVRVQSWDLAIGDLTPGNVLIGQGVNSFGQRHQDPSRPDKDIPGYLGNVFLQLIYDGGLIGTAMLLAGAATIVKRLSSRDARVLGVIACGAIIGAATSPLWFANWWVIAGLAAVVARRSEASTRRIPSRRAPLASQRRLAEAG
jgi:hypothetical protein